MASCTYNPNINNVNPYAVLNVTQQSQNIANNTTVVKYELLLYRPSQIISSASKNYSITVNGSTVASGTTTIGGSGTKSIASGTTTISHNADGTKSISFGFSLAFGITWNGVSIGTGSASGSMALSTIPRTSSISISPASVSLGNSIAVTISRASSAFTHTLQHDFAAGKWTTFATNAATSASLATSLSWAARIPSSTSSTGRIRCLTYSGSTLIGEKIVNFTGTVPPEVIPVINTITVNETVAGLEKQFGAFIQGKSVPKITVSAAGAQGSTISTYVTSIGGSNYAGSSFTGKLLNTAGSIPVTAKVTDSRGRSASKTVNVTVVPYSPPNISSFTVGRCTSNGTPNSDGTYVQLKATGTIAGCNNQNANSWSLQYKPTSSSTWLPLLSGTGFQINVSQAKTITGGFLTTSTYDFQLNVKDYFTTATSAKAIPTAFALMNFRPTGKGLAIGKISEKDVLEVGVPAEFSGTVKVLNKELSTLFLAQAGEPTSQTPGSLWFREVT